jgi:hypothetical protein
VKRHRQAYGSLGEGQAAVVGSHQLLKESFCRGNVTPGAKHELDCLPA